MITAHFTDLSRPVEVYGPWQHDHGQQLQITGITGLTPVTQVHFAKEGAAKAEIRAGTVVDDVLTVAIPDPMYLTPQDWWAYVYITDGDSGKTVCGVIVRYGTHTRPAPDDTVTPDDLSLADVLTAQLNALIATVGDVNNAAAESAAEAAASAQTAADEADRATNNILNGVATHNASNAAHGDIRDEVRTVEAIARGRATAHVFDTYAAMMAWLGVPANVEELVTGDNLYIRDTGVKDYWWDGAAAKELEAEAPDLTDYYTREQVDAMLPIAIEQTDYDVLVTAGTVEAGRIYYVVPDGTL